MYALFLESYAARQIDASYEADLAKAEEVKLKAYANSIKVGNHYGRGKTEEEQSGWWVEQCLEGDRHKELDLNELFTWGITPEGQDFWAKINRKRIK